MRAEPRLLSTNESGPHCQGVKILTFECEDTRLSLLHLAVLQVGRAVGVPGHGLHDRQHGEAHQGYLTPHHLSRLEHCDDKMLN